MSRRRPLSTATLVVLIGAALLLSAAFVALGQWQLQRRVWKLDLIERVTRNTQAAPVPVPGPAQWAPPALADQAYRRVQLQGRYLDTPSTRVQALTELGSGHWLLSPLHTTQGVTVLVNRGFVPDGAPASEAAAGTAVTVTGLLRLTEPGGGFLRANDPAAGRWFSRDVAAIATAQGLAAPVAPFFVDAQAQPAPPLPAAAAAAWPRPGMTVLSFRNHHLGYALTWFALAALAAAAAALLARSEWRLRQAPSRLNRDDGGNDGTGTTDRDQTPDGRDEHRGLAPPGPP